MRVKCLRVIERLGRKQPGPTLAVPQVANRQPYEKQHHHRHACQQNLVGPRRRLHPRQIQHRHDPGNQCGPCDVGNLRQVALMQSGRDPDGVDERLQQVVENHRPARQKSQMRIEAPAHIRIRRARSRIQRTHASIADRGDQHGEQGDQDDGDEVTVRKFLRHAVQRHRRNRLDQNDAVKNQIPKRERTPQTRHTRTGRGGG